ncbi:hypothetical protein AWJ20_703 [Sugiyamaella lignohabitans]|uniref:Survival motor neuron Tudor domain-containing protein n=1 Tax=Sugiyamaella lignohabitans TaxID=796027 RepID=A0A161HKT0_9ASCO|nr:uncharacterized protein AWJ20_703 [Sugiyamaella lignohabitans]ANB12448.1 hypothetical protein AWJ20_703 [Sugiyamaella lignohabitans]
MDQDSQDEAKNQEDESGLEGKVEDQEVAISEVPAAVPQPELNATQPQEHQQQTIEAVSGDGSTPNPFDGLPPSVRELVMAWYWAGYYQGLHKGRSERAGNSSS